MSCENRLAAACLIVVASAAEMTAHADDLSWDVENIARGKPQMNGYEIYRAKSLKMPTQGRFVRLLFFPVKEPMK